MLAGNESGQQAITLKGSTEIVTEFFGYAINSVLYQRGIYPPDSFTRMKKYGLALLVTTDNDLKEYLTNVLSQLRDWLLVKTVQKLVIVITSADTGAAVERWQFNIECDKALSVAGAVQKGEKEIHNEIQAIIRQITASVTFLPLIEDKCTFDVLIYADKNTDVPLAWEESDARIIAKSQEVKLRSFNTTVHKIESLVSYRDE
eukprot:Opistho-2@89271